MSKEFSEMLTDSLLPPKVETYFITNDGVVEKDIYESNPTEKEKARIRPEFEKFSWIKDPVYNLFQLSIYLLDNTNSGNKSVIAIFEDHTIKYKLNVDENFKPTLDLKDFLLSHHYHSHQ